MSRLTTNQVKTLMEAYQEVYSPKNLTEEDQNNLLMIEFYNALVEEGFIRGEIIEELYETEILESLGLSTRIAGAVQKYGPKLGSVLQKLTGFGLGPGSGGKRRAVTIGASSAAAAPHAEPVASNLGARAQQAGSAFLQDPKKKSQFADSFDFIKGHLLDEGYADTEEAALAIMANMSEEWRQSIIEQNAIVTTGTSTNAAGKKIPWEHRVEPSGEITIDGRRQRQHQSKLKGV